MTYFKGKVGEGHVKGHKYDISTKDGKSLVQAKNWSSVVKTGTVLVMSMIVEKAVTLNLDLKGMTHTCPHCYKTHLGVMKDEGWLQW